MFCSLAVLVVVSYAVLHHLNPGTQPGDLLEVAHRMSAGRGRPFWHQPSSLTDPDSTFGVLPLHPQRRLQSCPRGNLGHTSEILRRGVNIDWARVKGCGPHGHGNEGPSMLHSTILGTHEGPRWSSLRGHDPSEIGTTPKPSELSLAFEWTPMFACFSVLSES